MTNQEINTVAQKVINFKLNSIKFSVRKCYRQASDFERLSCTWMERISDKVNQEMKDILDLTDGNYSLLNVAVSAMKGRTIKAK